MRKKQMQRKLLSEAAILIEVEASLALEMTPRKVSLRLKREKQTRMIFPHLEVTSIL